MAGYKDYSMSNNAVFAYGNGMRPFSKWTKKEILQMLKAKHVVSTEHMNIFTKMTLAQLKDAVLCYEEWHHTSSYYNKTDFYRVDYDPKMDYTIFLKEVAQDKPKEEESEEVWLCTYLEWGGTRNHPTAKTHKAYGVIKGDWFYFIPTNENVVRKKKVSANGFQKVKKFDNVPDPLIADLPISKTLLGDLVATICNRVHCKKNKDLALTIEYFKENHIDDSVLDSFLAYCEEKKIKDDAQVVKGLADAVFDSDRDYTRYVEKPKLRKRKEKEKEKELKKYLSSAFVRVLVNGGKYFVSFSALKKYNQKAGALGLENLTSALVDNHATIFMLNEDGTAFKVDKREGTTSSPPSRSIVLIPATEREWKVGQLSTPSLLLKLRVAIAFNYKRHKTPVFLIVEDKSCKIPPCFKDNVFETFEDAQGVLWSLEQEQSSPYMREAVSWLNRHLEAVRELKKALCRKEKSTKYEHVIRKIKAWYGTELSIHEVKKIRQVLLRLSGK